MSKAAVLVWFILIGGKPIGMSFREEMSSLLACQVHLAKIMKVNQELIETGVAVEVYASCEQDR